MLSKTTRLGRVRSAEQGPAWKHVAGEGESTASLLVSATGSGSTQTSAVPLVCAEFIWFGIAVIVLSFFLPSLNESAPWYLIWVIQVWVVL